MPLVFKPLKKEAKNAAYKPVQDDVPFYTPSVERVKEPAKPTPTHECNIKLYCTRDEMNHLGVGVWALAKTENEERVASWSHSNTDDNHVLLSAKCLEGEEKELIHDVFIHAGHSVRQTVMPTPIGASHIHAEYVPVKLMLQTSERGLAWSSHGYYYHFVDGVLMKEYKVIGNGRWALQLTASREHYLTDELLSEHCYSAILLPYKHEGNPLPTQHLLFQSEKLASKTLADMTPEWLDENAVTLDLDKIVAIRQCQLLERAQEQEEESEETAPLEHTVKLDPASGECETWSEIAAQYGLAPKALLSLNPIYDKDPLSLKAGDRLQTQERKEVTQAEKPEQPHPIPVIEDVHAFGDVWGRYRSHQINDKLVNIFESRSVSGYTPVVNAGYLAYEFTKDEWNKNLQEELKSYLEDRHTQVCIFSVDDAAKCALNIWQQKKEDGETIGSDILNILNEIHSKVDMGVGLVAAAKVSKALGGLGVTVKQYFDAKGIERVIVSSLWNDSKMHYAVVNGLNVKKNHPYRITNPTIKQLGVLAEDTVNGFKKGAVLSFIISATINTNELVFNDDYHLVDWCGSMGSDLFKAMSVLALSSRVVVFTVAFGISMPLIAGVLVWVGIELFVDWMWDKFEVKSTIVNRLKDATR